MRTTARRGTVSALLLLMALSSGVAANAQTPPRFDKATFESQGVEIDLLTDGIQMTKEDEGPARGYTGPTFMAVNPVDPTVIVAATANLRTRQCFLLVSTDAGATWQFSENRPVVESYPFCTNTSAGVSQTGLAWGSNGTLYYASQAYSEEEGVARETSIMLARTTDLGATWESTLVADARSAEDPKPEYRGVTGMAVDTSGEQDAVYVGFSRSYRNSTESGDPLNNVNDVLVGVSTDGGQTFGEPANLNDQSELTRTLEDVEYPLYFQTGFGRPFLVAHGGVIMAVANGGPPSGHPVTDLVDGSFTYGQANPMLVARSTDQGETWTVSELNTPIFSSSGAQTGMGWTQDGGPDGTFIFAYAATPADAPSAGLADVVFQRSTDLGETWSEPLALNDDDPDDLFTSFYPQLDVAPNGRVDVIWQDNRDLTDYEFNVRYTYSTDGGETWAPNVKVSDQPVDFKFGISFNSDVRQPPGVASTDAYALIGWADPRFADEISQTQDNFAVRAQFGPLPSSGNQSFLPVVAAVFAGLAVAGLALLIFQRSGGGGGAAPAGSGGKKPKPAKA